MDELNIRNCKDCNKVFRTLGKTQLCPSCRKKHQKESQKMTAEQTKAIKIKTSKPHKPKVTLAEEQRIERIYNAIHKSRYHGYSEIISIIENRKDNTCVCKSIPFFYINCFYV